MIVIDNGKCIGCGNCLQFMGGYCLHEKDGVIEIDYTVCNECQKCVSICPGLAFTNGGELPERIETPPFMKAAELTDLLRRRRSIKHFQTKKVPRELLEQIVQTAGYAPSMNKDIEAVVIDDPECIRQIDRAALKFYARLYRLMFGSRWIVALIRRFADTLPVIKRKMERDLRDRGHIVKDNTQALIILIGNTKTPVTESSAQYYLANMLLYCEAAGLGSCLMDSLKVALNRSKAVKARLNIPGSFGILGILAVGYPAEKIINIPKGYTIKTGWNRRSG